MEFLHCFKFNKNDKCLTTFNLSKCDKKYQLINTSTFSKMLFVYSQKGDYHILLQ